MWFPNAWFSKIGLLAVGALLWGGGAQAGTSLDSLSKEPLFQCVKERFYSCFVQYYALPTDLSGELVETGRDGQNIPLSDNPRGSEMSPRLEKVLPILSPHKLGFYIEHQLSNKSSIEKSEFCLFSVKSCHQQTWSELILCFN